MALTAIERSLLMGARKALANGNADRICYALNHARDNFGGPAHMRASAKEAAARLRGFIMKAIEGPNEIPNFGLEDWLVDHGATDIARNDVALRNARMAWIDWMLDEPWTEHHGGKCPLLPHEKVTIRKRNGTELTRFASQGRWYHWPIEPGDQTGYGMQDTVAYKVHYETPKNEA